VKELLEVPCPRRLKLKQDALKESKKQNWKIARNNTLENIEN